MKPGEVFNPRFEVCGFHPEEIVAKRRDLTDGQKWLYARMVRWARSTDGERPNEHAGEVWRSHENIAVELGKSAKQVGRDLAKLESERLISHRKRDGRKSNTYVFVFHEDFEPTPMSSQTEFERTPMSAQKAAEAAPTGNLNGHPRPVRTDLNGHPRPVNPSVSVINQKAFNQQEHTREDSGRLKDLSAANSAGAGESHPENANTQRPTASAPTPRTWPMGGWESVKDFEAWWTQIVCGHPNKNRNAIAKTTALELIMAGELDRAGFEAGYAARRTEAGDRWTEEHGRYAPNLCRLLDDRAWKYPPDLVLRRPPAPDCYQNANDYIQRVQAE